MSTRSRREFALVFTILLTLSSTGAGQAATAEPGFEDLPGRTVATSRPGIPRPLATDAATGAGATLGVGAGTWMAQRLGAEPFHAFPPALWRAATSVLSSTALRDLPAVIPGLLPALGGGLVGGAISAVMQKKLTGRVDWGSVAFSSVGGVRGATMLGIPGGIVGSVAGDLAWRGGRALFKAAMGPRRAEPARARAWRPGRR